VLISKKRTKEIFEDIFNRGYDFLAKQDKRKPKMSPSSVKTCLRKHYWSAIGEKESNPITFNSGSKLEFGKLFHTYLERLISAVEPGFKLETEVSFDGIKGTLDCLADLDGKKYIVDFKTTADYSFKQKVIAKSVSETYICQATLYALAAQEKFNIKIDGIIILLFSRNVDRGVKYEPFIYKLDSENIGKVKDYFDTLKRYVNAKALPPAIPFETWECGYCNYVDLCKGGNK